PDSGEIEVDGLLLSPQTVNEVRKKITYVSQDADLPKGIVSDVFKEVFSFHANRQIGYQQDHLQKWLQRFSLPADTIDKTMLIISHDEVFKNDAIREVKWS
ncbi:MAG: UDP-glucose/iron transport system ATP-binding protein, partial [Eubacteriaceae bacterium]|nr:UDP-glucose/iron transport system ATP-binding protein [Eubacteriaceae bacterium]